MNRFQHKRNLLRNRMENKENVLMESLGMAAVNGLARSFRWMFSSDKKKEKENSNREEIRIVSSDEYEKIRRSILSGEGDKEVHELVKKEKNNMAVFIGGLSVAVGFIAISRMKKKGKFRKA